VRFELPRTLEDDAQGGVCVKQGPGGRAAFLGSLDHAGLQVDGRYAKGAVTMSYYRPGAESLIALMPVIAQRIGLTRGHFGGAWRGIAIVLLFVAGVALAAFVLIALARGRSVRRAALLCATVAVLNSLAWGLLTPTFQVPDEPFHLSYVQDLAEHGKPPEPKPFVADRYSDELGLIVSAANLVVINFNPFGRPSWSVQQDAELEAALAKKPSTDNPGAIGSLKDYPPLFYAVLVPLYEATHAAGGSTLDAITLIRILGGLLAGVTILALFAFLTELFPGREARVAAVSLVVAYQPVFTWIQGGVNPDALLIPLGAVLFWLFARAWNRGLSVWSATGIGLAFAASVLVKLSALGLAVGFALGLALLAWRRRRGRWKAPVLAGVAAGAVPLALYALLNSLVWDRPLVPGGVSAAATGPAGPAGPSGQAVSGFWTYLWQYLLPPVGSMTNFFHLAWLPRDFWTPLWVGKFGWFDYEFPHTVNTIAFVFYVVVAIAALAAILLHRRREWLLWLLFTLTAAGLAGAIAKAGYPLRSHGHFIFEQARYFMPLLALYALALALAASLLRRRAELAVLSLLVAVSSAQLLGAFILTVRRYYL
jgi:4-amino-4-deoxy-L-arabinose transferase-like glycosyltransferase